MTFFLELYALSFINFAAPSINNTEYENGLWIIRKGIAVGKRLNTQLVASWS